MKYNTNDLDNKNVKFTLEQVTKAHRWSIGEAYSFFNLGARCGWVVNVTPWPLYPRERDPASIVEEAEWAPGEKSRPPPGFVSRTFQPHSKSLYRSCKLLVPPMKMERTECSETSAHKIQKPEIHPKERILLSHLPDTRVLVLV
jgi:hypothetical protein